ncbi:hypothetical protein LIER_00852 [Lithospermum erythrorhizon]|uniref:Reverse transcriptase domain-containing protein n=1 Tax=Lithospermum erythrorhizon TaxID=34254 RepID=A0AAV3NIX1_LITER
MMVDTGSSADIVYLRAYDKLGLSRKHLKTVATPLTGFTGHYMHPVGIAELDVTVGNGSRTVTVRASFTVVDIADKYYNGLIGRPLLTVLRAIVSHLHLKMKFPTPGGVGEMSGDKKRGRECYQLSIPKGLSRRDPPKRKRYQEKHPGVMNVREPTTSESQDNDPKELESRKRGEPHEDLEMVAFDERKPDRVFRIGTRLGEEHMKALIDLIKKLVDGSAGHEVFDFLDASRGYHQIIRDAHDQEKTAFITEYGLYCWRVMSFGLKNARAIYQRMVNAIFKSQIGIKMDIYVDDMLVKSKKRGDHFRNLEESLGRLNECKLRINPEKCSFG